MNIKYNRDVVLANPPLPLLVNLVSGYPNLDLTAKKETIL